MVKQFEMVSVPSTTLNALKGLLFNSENGVDLSSIVNDLKTADVNEELLSINVGLTFKGLKPTIDTASRYGYDYKSVIRYDFVSYSMILNKVTCKRTRIAEWDDKKGDMIPCNKDSYDVTFSIEDWLNKDTDRTKSTEYIVSRYKKEESAQ